MGDALKMASNRIYNLFLDARRTREAWSAGEREYVPTNPDARRFFDTYSTFIAERVVLRQIIEDIITEELGKVSAEIPAETPGHRAAPADAGGTSPSRPE